MGRYVCGICGYVYDEDRGDPDNGIEPGTEWKDLPDDWACPMCTAPKSVFEKEGGGTGPAGHDNAEKAEGDAVPGVMSFAALSVICSNLSKGCEKQYKTEESELFNKLAEYFDAKAGKSGSREFDDIGEMIAADLGSGYPLAKQAAGDAGDRGALRALVWGEKATNILRAVLMRYSKSGSALLEDTRIYVCEICGFVYIGDVPPEVCPVCKVPAFRISQIARR